MLSHCAYAGDDRLDIAEMMFALMDGMLADPEHRALGIRTCVQR